MKNGEFQDYIESYIANLGKVNDKAKANFFLTYLKEYLDTEMGVELDAPDVFGILDKEFLLGSIEYYLKGNPAKNVAESYRRTIIELIETVCKDYSIRSDFLESNSERSDFIKATADLFSNLKQSESRECMSTEDYETLDETLSDFFNTEKLEERINKSITIENYKPNYYERLVSAIALRLVQQYGLANKTIANLKISDVDLENGSLEIRGFTLPINEKLKYILELYFRCRYMVNSKFATDTLFIKKDGAPYFDINGNVDNGQLFMLMDMALGNTSTTKLRYRTIAELVSKRINVNLLCTLTGVNEKTIGRITHDYESALKRDLYNIFSVDNHSYMQVQKIHRKGQIRCPFCGAYWSASSENWILIQVHGDEKKHIACRECKGFDGKYKY